jgi:hypothetical protein
MPKYPIRLIEQYSTSGHADFLVEAPTAEHAADIVLDAHHAMRSEGATVINLPDGQSQIIECGPEEGPAIRVVLLDSGGAPTRELRAADALGPDGEDRHERGQSAPPWQSGRQGSR